MGGCKAKKKLRVTHMCTRRSLVHEKEEQKGNRIKPPALAAERGCVENVRKNVFLVGSFFVGSAQAFSSGVQSGVSVSAVGFCKGWSFFIMKMGIYGDWWAGGILLSGECAVLVVVCCRYGRDETTLRRPLVRVYTSMFWY